MKCLKHKKSGVIVKATNQVAAHLLNGGVYVPSTKGAYKRQQKRVNRESIPTAHIEPKPARLAIFKRLNAITRRSKR